MVDPKTSPYIYAGLHNSAQTRIKHSNCFNKGELDIIAMACCDEYDLTFEEFKGKCRSATLADARKIFFYLCRREFYEFTCKRLGMYVDRDHSTVVYSVKRAGELLEIDPTFRDKYKHAKGVAELRLKLNGYSYSSSKKLINYGTRDQRLPSLESTDCREGSSYTASAVGELNC